jgi:hypothetical protein
MPCVIHGGPVQEEESIRGHTEITAEGLIITRKLLNADEANFNARAVLTLF